MTNLEKIKNYSVHDMRGLMISLTHPKTLCRTINCKHKDEAVCGGLNCKTYVESWLGEDAENEL